MKRRHRIRRPKIRTHSQAQLYRDSLRLKRDRLPLGNNLRDYFDRLITMSYKYERSAR